MNLPLVLDIAIGLIFIYLILSLLASEVQEILATLFQWRATHLKRSIENLLMGGKGASQDEAVREIKRIVDDIYNNPLIKTINQEAKEGADGSVRQLVWQVGRMYRAMRGQNTTSFGKDDRTREDKRSAPSYIPSETFATTLLERLNIAVLTHKLSTLRLLQFKDREIVSELERILARLEVSEETHYSLNKEFEKLKRNLDKIFLNFQSEKSTLLNSLNQIKSELHTYGENSKTYFTENETASQKEFDGEIMFLKQGLFINSDDLLQRLKPGLIEIIDLLETGDQLYRGLKEKLKNQDSELFRAYEGIEAEIQRIGQLPQPIKKTLSVLARRSQMRADQVGQELYQFQKEIEIWFDNSMDRASGVYKRNAKGVAFLIGLLLAFVANADTFHMVSRLSKDTPLRQAIAENAGQVGSDPICSNLETPSQASGQLPSRLDCIRDRVNRTLGQMSLPVGRSPDNLQQQQDESKHWFFPPLRRILGWILSGFAISMGAPFWFELLGKIVNVRNTGPKPASSADKRYSSQ